MATAYDILYELVFAHVYGIVIMKLSDFVAYFLAQQSIRQVFAISGGASLHLIHSVADNAELDFVCPHHEQAAAMAADAYARLSGNIGAAIATSGPGATNLITGICCAFYDSVPVLFVTGQVSTFRMRGDTGVRQLGFQETDIVNVVRPITKYAALVRDPKDVRYELEKAVWIAHNGRPGPVLIDIPDNLQRKDIDVAALRGFTPEPAPAEPKGELADDVRQVCSLLAAAERPVLVLGWGVRLAKCVEDALAFVHHAGIPTLLTWGRSLSARHRPAAHRLLRDARNASWEFCTAEFGPRRCHRLANGHPQRRVTVQFIRPRGEEGDDRH